MTADIRTAAEDAMIRANAVEPLVVVDGEEAVMQLTDYGNGFIAGAAWAAERVTPTREQIAEELRKHKLIHAAVSRKSAFCACNPGVTAGTDANLEWFEAHRADAILALMQELAEGEHK